MENNCGIISDREFQMMDHLDSARKLFSDLQRGPVEGDVDAIAQKIRQHVSDAGANLTALDRMRYTNEEQMEARLEKVVRRAHLKKVEKEISDIKAGKVKADTAALEGIRQRLMDLGAPAQNISHLRQEQKIDRLHMAAEDLASAFLLASMNMQPGALTIPPRKTASKRPSPWG
jgi:hypothetical protein